MDALQGHLLSCINIFQAERSKFLVYIGYKLLLIGLLFLTKSAERVETCLNLSVLLSVYYLCRTIYLIRHFILYITDLDMLCSIPLISAHSIYAIWLTTLQKKYNII